MGSCDDKIDRILENTVAYKQANDIQVTGLEEKLKIYETRLEACKSKTTR